MDVSFELESLLFFVYVTTHQVIFLSYRTIIQLRLLLMLLSWDNPKQNNKFCLNFLHCIHNGMCPVGMRKSVAPWQLARGPETTTEESRTEHPFYNSTIHPHNQWLRNPFVATRQPLHQEEHCSTWRFKERIVHFVKRFLISLPFLLCRTKFNIQITERDCTSSVSDLTAQKSPQQPPSSVMWVLDPMEWLHCVDSH